MHPLTIVVVSRLAKIASKHFTSSDTFPSLVLPGDLFLETKEGRIQEKNIGSNQQKKKKKKVKNSKRKKKEIQQKICRCYPCLTPILRSFRLSFHPHRLYTVLPLWRLAWLPTKWPRITRIPWKISLQMTGSKSAI